VLIGLGGLEKRQASGINRDFGSRVRVQHAMNADDGSAVDLLGVEAIPEGDIVVERFFKILQVDLVLRSEYPPEVILRDGVDLETAVKSAVNDLDVFHERSLLLG
jgi:hypothetical protein